MIKLAIPDWRRPLLVAFVINGRLMTGLHRLSVTVERPALRCSSRR
jgi:hypothetical protein